MSSSQGPKSSNGFKCHIENIWFENCLTQFKPVVYRRYVYGIFLLFRSIENAEKFKMYLNRQHRNIEQSGPLSFLDIKVSQENKISVPSIYRMPTFSGVFTNFETFISKSYKCTLTHTLSYRKFSLYSNMENLHQEISSVKSVFKSIGYSKNFADSCISNFLGKLFVES